MIKYILKDSRYLPFLKRDQRETIVDKRLCFSNIHIPTDIAQSEQTNATKQMPRMKQ